MNLDSSVMNVKKIMNSVFCKELPCGMTTNLFSFMNHKLKHHYYKTGSEFINHPTRRTKFLTFICNKSILLHCVLIALIQSSSSLKSPGPDRAPGTPPSALTEKDMPRTRDGFISISASITFPLQVGRYRARGIWSFNEITKHMAIMQNIEIYNRK